MSESTTIRWERGEDGVVVLTLDDPDQSANTMHAGFRVSLAATVERLEAEREDITGVVIASAKQTVFAGADLNEMIGVRRERSEHLANDIRALKSCLRRLETLGKPVVAAINGAALGGGLELALATHRRIVVDDPKIQLGQPEVQLGLLPAAGGVVRTVRMLGLVDALMQVLLQGKPLRPQKAKELGLVDDLVAGADDLIPAAKAWIAANPEATQRWDVKGYKIPGGTPSSPKLAPNLPAFPATRASSSRAPITRRRTTSCASPSRARRSTSTVRWRSRRATSSTLPPGRWPRT
jgi:3-hydroxyacyl-CoA dehydrogenase / enoyl-CoA hydratase / 3-hydroxybutyryl-CoA epimerase